MLAAAMDKDALAAYLASAPGTALVPEQMVLRRPERTIDGKETWRAYRRDDRVLVRVSDGTGFAARNDMLHAVWLLAERPAIESFGAPLGTDLVWSDHADTCLPHPGDLADADLRQGAYLPARGLKRPLKWLAAAVAVAALGHLAIAAFDLRAQRAIAEDLRADARAALAAHLPNASIDDAPELILRRLAARNQPQVGSTFLPVLERVAQALSRTGVAVQFRQLTWSDDAMRLTIEAPDLDHVAAGRGQPEGGQSAGFQRNDHGRFRRGAGRIDGAAMSILARLNPRERVIVLGGGAFLIALAAWFYIWQPLASGTRRTGRTHRTLSCRDRNHPNGGQPGADGRTRAGQRRAPDPPHHPKRRGR